MRPKSPDIQANFMPDFSCARSGTVDVMKVNGAPPTSDARKRKTVSTTRSRPCAIVAPETVKIEAVSKVSAARKLGIAARVAKNVATQRAQRSRTVRAARGAMATTARAFGRVLHQLWLEVTGLVFFIVAISFGAAAF